MDGTIVQRHLTGIEPLSGSNFKKWKSQLEIVLGWMEYDISLTEEMPAVPEPTATKSAKTEYLKWMKANKMAMMIIKSSIGDIFKAEFQQRILQRSY